MMGRALSSEKRHCVIGFVASTIYARLPALIRAFRAAAPDIQLNLVEMVSSIGSPRSRRDGSTSASAASGSTIRRCDG